MSDDLIKEDVPGLGMVIFLDSNIIRQDPRTHKLGMQAISYYCRLGIVKIILPNVVRDEIISQNDESAENELVKIDESIGRLVKLGLSDSGYTAINRIREVINSNRGDIRVSLNVRFLEWISKNNIEILDSSENVYRKVMEDYFNGVPPFDKRRNKSHIPDAIIYHTIKKYIESSRDRIYILTNDALLKSNLDKLDCKCLNSADDLIQDKEFRQYIDENIIDYKDEIDKIFLLEIRNKIRIISSKLLYVLQEDLEDVCQFEELPGISTSHQQMDEIRNISVSSISTNPIKFSENSFSLDFQAKAEASFSYIITNEQFERLDFGTRDITITQEDDGNLYVYETAEIDIDGSMGILIEEKEWQSIYFDKNAAWRFIDRSNLSVIEVTAKINVDRIYSINENWLDVADGLYDSQDEELRLSMDDFDVVESLTDVEDLPF